MRNILDRTCGKNRNTRFRHFFFRKARRLWDNVGKYGRVSQNTDNTIRRMIFAYWLNKSTDTHSEYVTFIACSQQQCLHERASILH